ncbi:unnamed protein product [Leptidea sinapis]|uniref:Essential protein Yae1 N-terminal domain-containing protein n=1 Tax=Leptidea sinapis TaxID=189913 RepID=A0A5E4Q2L9_9NEOP|nr:unnamed protein product [Leptidea sinapis]
MSDENIILSQKTWERTADSIYKTNYSDGVVDGQNSTFQTSFDIGYEEGFKYGFSLGLSDAMLQNGEVREYSLQDPDKINCLLCIEPNKIEDNVVNLINLQNERNQQS